MKLITHKKQVIGIAASGARDAVVSYACPEWTSKDKGPIDAAMKSDAAVTLAFVVYAPEEGDSFVMTFARPLTFKLERARPRVTQVTQADLPLRTAADPATLFNDIAFEVLELVRATLDPNYAAHPDYQATCASVRALVSVRKLGPAAADSP